VTVVRRVERWESVWETVEVEGWVGGRRRGRGPRRREVDKGEWEVRWDSRVGEDGGSETVFA